MSNMVRVSWDPPADDFIDTEVRYKQTALADWLAAPVAEDATSVHIGPLAASTEYEFQVRHRSNTSWRVTEWSASYITTVGTAPPGEAPWLVGTGLDLDTATDPDTLSLSVPVSIAHGGTGATTATSALINLGAAGSPVDGGNF